VNLPVGTAYFVDPFFRFFLYYRKGESPFLLGLRITAKTAWTRSYAAIEKEPSLLRGAG
jgi:hypothetical protein